MKNQTFKDLPATGSLDWEKRRIGDLCLVGDGTHMKIKRQASGVLYLTAKNLKPGGLDLSRVDYITEADFQKYFRANAQSLRKPQGGDVLFGIIGSIGEPYLVKPDEQFGISSSVAILRPNPRELWGQYLYYWIKSPFFQTTLQSLSAGVVQAYVSLDVIKSLPIHYPSVENQRRIADILSDYDAAIANNSRRIKLLEEMAQTIYREWFLEWRSPDITFLPATAEQKLLTGKDVFPAGWEIQRIGEVVETLGGDTPSRKKAEYWENGNLTWYRTTDLTAANTMFITDSENKITALGLSKSKMRMFPPYSVMMTSRATVGVVAINTTDACTNQGFITCLPNDRVSAYYLYFWLRQSRDKIYSLASGMMYREVNLGWFRQMPMIIPDPTLHSRFVESLEPLTKAMQNLQAKNLNLRRSADLLSVKLLSGEIEVENIEQRELSSR